ncbi:hypothetical protein GW17_00061060 [Ensete ventricosum]|nr:hypothetical protein GW17_00061060 [Ensete ventricosum]RZR98737.1 hypothetical protein BHM03_00028163 [Ensete ventricosum]
MLARAHTHKEADPRKKPTTNGTTYRRTTLQRRQVQEGKAKQKEGIWRCLQAQRAKWSLALAGLEVEDEHGQHGDPGMLDLRKLQPLQLLLVRHVHAVLQGAGEAQGVEELATRVTLVAGGVGEVLGGTRPRGSPLNGLRLRVEEVDPALRLHPPHEEELGAEERAEGEGRDGAGVGAGFEPRHAAPRLADEDADHRRHRPAAVDQLSFPVPLQEGRVLAEAKRVEPVVTREPAGGNEERSDVSKTPRKRVVALVATASEEKRGTYEPSSHSGSIKLPPPLTAGIQDFFGAAAATTRTLLGEPAAAAEEALPPAVAFRRFRAALEPERKGVEIPWRTAAEVEAMAIALGLQGKETPPETTGFAVLADDEGLGVPLWLVCGAVVLYCSVCDREWEPPNLKEI